MPQQPISNPLPHLTQPLLNSPLQPKPPALPNPTHTGTQTNTSTTRTNGANASEHRSPPPGEKPVHAKHRACAFAQLVSVDIDAAKLPANSSGFGGCHQNLPHDTCDAHSLCIQPGWRYISHSEHGGAVPIVDCHQHMVALVGGSPQDVACWQEEVVVPLQDAIAEGASKLTFSATQLQHKRGTGFAALSSGVPHGGGEAVSVCFVCFPVLLRHFNSILEIVPF